MHCLEILGAWFASWIQVPTWSKSNWWWYSCSKWANDVSSLDALAGKLLKEILICYNNSMSNGTASMERVHTRDWQVAKQYVVLQHGLVPAGVHSVNTVARICRRGRKTTFATCKTPIRPKLLAGISGYSKQVTCSKILGSFQSFLKSSMKWMFSLLIVLDTSCFQRRETSWRQAWMGWTLMLCKDIIVRNSIFRLILIQPVQNTIIVVKKVPHFALKYTMDTVLFLE